MTRLSDGLFLTDDSSYSVCPIEELIDFYGPKKLKKTGTAEDQFVTLNSENLDQKSGTHFQKHQEMPLVVSRKKPGKTVVEKPRN